MMKLKDYAEQGCPLDPFFVVDIHSHLGAHPDPYIPYTKEDEQIQRFDQTMSRVGIDFAVVSMLRGLNTGELEANLDLARLMKTYRKVLGWCTYVPQMARRSLDVAEHCFRESDRFIGMKIHPDVNTYPINGPLYDPLWEFADARQLLVLVHTWGTGGNANPGLLRDIMERYHHVKVLIGHSGGMGGAIDLSINLANKYDRLFLDLTGAFLYSQRRLEYFAERADHDKLLFSSDAIFNGMAWEIGNILYARVPDALKEKVLGLNARRLIASFINL